MSYVSVCVLSYNRLEFLKECIASLDYAGCPIEIIVGDDGSDDPAVRRWLVEQLEAGVVSQLALSPSGHNEGVGRMVNRLFGMASGDYLVKCDQDCVFKPAAILRMREVLDNNRRAYSAGLEPLLGSVGGFRYWHDPVDHGAMHVRTHASGWHQVVDYVSSVMMITRSTWRHYGPWEQHSPAFAEDVDFKARLSADGLVHGITSPDCVLNTRFGIGPSTVVTAQGTVKPIHLGPKVFS